MLESWHGILHGLGIAFLPASLLYTLTGVFIGTMISHLPGIGPSAGIALLLPVTFGMEPTIALMMLAGIVVNNSLMLLEFVQQSREAGNTPEAAVVEAGHMRLRPIFMTVIGTVAGLLPLALGIGKGAEMQAPMAVTVIFGLVVSTLLTLVVMPALYLEARRYFEKD